MLAIRTYQARQRALHMRGPRFCGCGCGRKVDINGNEIIDVDEILNAMDIEGSEYKDEDDKLDRAMLGEYDSEEEDYYGEYDYNDDLYGRYLDDEDFEEEEREGDGIAWDDGVREELDCGADTPDDYDYELEAMLRQHDELDAGFVTGLGQRAFDPILLNRDNDSAILDPDDRDDEQYGCNDDGDKIQARTSGKDVDDGDTSQEEGSDSDDNEESTSEEDVSSESDDVPTRTCTYRRRFRTTALPLTHPRAGTTHHISPNDRAAMIMSLEAILQDLEKWVLEGYLPA